jgi:hypothetical protein
MREAIALLIPTCAIGVFLYRSMSVTTVRTAVAAVACAFCLGIGFSSVVSAALIAMGVAPTNGAFALIDMALWVIVAALGWWAARSPVPKALSREPKAQSREPWLLPAAFGVIALIALTSTIAASIAAPHGEWDAWAIWNQHARFLYRGGDGSWRDFSSIAWSQPDYPLLLPASVARVWAYAGNDSTLGPISIAIGFGIACVALVVTTLGSRRGWIAGALILGATTFVAQVPSQCADVPLACFIVATLAVTFGDVLRIADPGSRIPGPGSRLPDPAPRLASVIAGATSAMAAWTKNEGVVFVLLMLIVAAIAAARRRDGRPLLWSIVGAAPILLALAWFKLALAPASGLVEGQSVSVVLSRLLDFDRHATVLELVVQHATRWSAPIAMAIFPVVVLVAAWMAVRAGGAVRVMASVLGLMLLSYYVVYVTTPFDITWHVTTSVDRLMVQLWPALVLTVFLSLSFEP